MRFFLILIATLYTTMGSAALKTVPKVEVDKYLGRWYQIAKNPHNFEPRICACAQQTLKARSDGSVDVYNSCNLDSAKGKLVDIRGTATIDNPGRNSKLTVDFGRKSKGSYWIIGLDKKYRWAVVSDKRSYTLYILSKTPTLPKRLLKQALNAAGSQKSTRQLIYTSHKGCKYPKI